MSIKGFPSNQKLPLGTGITNDFVTVQPTDEFRNALDIPRFAFRVNPAPLTAGANTGTIDGVTWVYDTGTDAKKGDFIRFASGVNEFLEVPIVKVEANRFMLGAKVNGVVAGDTFYIMRYATQLVANDGSQIVTVTSAPIEFVKNNVNTQVEEDTVTPANSVPLPVKVLDGTGVEVDFATETTLASVLANQTNDTQTTKITDGTNQLQITGANEAKTRIDAVKGDVDALNSTILPLGIGGVFTGSWVETLNKSAIQVGIESDQNSATNGFRVEFSQDGTNVAHYHDYTYEAGDGVGYLFQPEFKYYRVKYTNGAVAQTKLTIAAVLKPVSLFPSQYRVNKAITGQSQALVTKGVIYGETTGMGGGYHSVKVTPSGSLTTDSKLTGLDAAVLGQETMANSLPVAIASDQTLPLPTGAATDDAEGSVAGGTAGTKSLLAGGIYNSTPPTLTNAQQAALQLDASGNLKVNVVTGGGGGGGGTVDQGNKGSIAQSWYTQLTDGSANAVKVTDGAVGTADFALAVGLHPDSPLPAGSNNIGKVDVNTLPVAFNAGTASATTQRVVLASDQAPTSAAQAWFNKITDGTNAAAVKAASTAPAFADPALVVTISPNTFNPSQAGRSKVAQLFNDYTVTSVSTSAYTQLTASTSAAANKIEIFDSSGEALILAVGGAGSEVDQLYIFPGGNGAVDLAIPASSRISVKAKTATASSGFLAINLYS